MTPERKADLGRAPIGPRPPRGPMLVYSDGEWSLPADVDTVIVKVSPFDPNYRPGTKGWIIGGRRYDQT